MAVHEEEVSDSPKTARKKGGKKIIQQEFPAKMVAEPCVVFFLFRAASLHKEKQKTYANHLE